VEVDRVSRVNRHCSFYSPLFDASLFHLVHDPILLDDMPDEEEDLFFPASDEEQDAVETTGATKAAEDPLFFPPSQDSDIAIIDAPSTSHGSSPPLGLAASSLIAPSIDNIAGPSRKRPTPSRNASYASSSTSVPRTTRIPPGFAGGYLGEFVCEGWSLSKGKGYCSPGARIVFERPKAKDTAAEERRMAERHEKKSGPARLVNGKMVHAKGAKAGKQMTIGSMLKKSSPAPSAGKKADKKPVDQIIRFRNERGFEVGRLSVNEAGFLVHLLDTDISESGAGHFYRAPWTAVGGRGALPWIAAMLISSLAQRPCHRLPAGPFDRRDHPTQRQGLPHSQSLRDGGKAGAKGGRDILARATRNRSRGSHAASQRCPGRIVQYVHFRFIGLIAGDLIVTDRIGIKPLRSNALLLAQKKNGRAEINEKSLGHFSDQKGLNPNVPRRRSTSPSKKSLSSDSKDKPGEKEGESARNSDNEEDEAEDSGDEAEKLDEEQMNEIDSIYRK
jgi:DNA repair protein RAD5